MYKNKTFYSRQQLECLKCFPSLVFLCLFVCFFCFSMAMNETRSKTFANYPHSFTYDYYNWVFSIIKPFCFHLQPEN